MHLATSTAELPVQFQSDTIIISSNLATLRLHEISFSQITHEIHQIARPQGPVMDVFLESGRVA